MLEDTILKKIKKITNDDTNRGMKTQRPKTRKENIIHTHR